jgi:hypothetical protein
MPIEIELGTMIRRMNPYTDGTRRSMHFYPIPRGGTATSAAADAALAAEAARQAAHAAGAAFLAAAARASAASARVPARASGTVVAYDALADVADDAVALAHIDVEVENYDHYEGQWMFKAQAYNIRRALLIPYRYPLKDQSGNENGLYATEYLLVGFAGVNGP